jgi:hypothetical protein
MAQSGDLDDEADRGRYSPSSVTIPLFHRGHAKSEAVLDMIDSRQSQSGPGAKVQGVQVSP